MCIYILRVSVDHINITSRHFDGCIRAAVTSPYCREMFTVLTGNQQQNKCLFTKPTMLTIKKQKIIALFVVLTDYYLKWALLFFSVLVQ